MLADHTGHLCVYFLPFGMAPVTENRPEDTNVENNSSNKLRKVMVEKVRRDRINQSIEQLRTLLHPGGEQSGAQSSSSRLEKADVLEIVVRFLRQKAMARAAAPSYSQGFSQCLQESLRHLSLHSRLKPAEREEIKRFYVHQRTALQRSASAQHGHRRTGTSKRSTTSRSSPRTQGRLWRPW